MAGLGLDIMGACWLARSVIVDDTQIVDTSTTRLDFSTPLIATQVLDRIHGRVGIGLLVLGFALQACGYFTLVISGAELEAGWRRGVGAVLALIAGLILGQLIESGYRALSHKKQLVSVARSLHESKTEWLGPRHMRSIGDHYFEPLQGESDLDYSVRVFRLEPGDPLLVVGKTNRA